MQVVNVMENNKSYLLNHAFSRKTFTELASKESSEILTAAIRRYVDAEGKTYGECISELYIRLKDGYRNEYFYKNTLLNKLLVNSRKHDPLRTAALTELPIGRSIADFVLVNGRAVVYEIKTDLDNLDRLPEQLSNYYKAFCYVSVVTAESCADKVSMLITGKPVGLMLLTKRGALKEVVKPRRSDAELDYKVIYNVLRKKERDDILVHHGFSLPPNGYCYYYRECLEMFRAIPVKDVHREMEEALKKRTLLQLSRIDGMPEELNFLAYFSHMGDDEMARMKDFLEKEA